MCRCHCLLEVRKHGTVEVGGHTYTDLDKQGVWGWMGLGEGSAVSAGHTALLKAYLDQPSKTPTQHIVQIGCLVSKIVPYEGCLLLLW